jgi:eukaryotic-like serine/threonine-protein kinase
MIAFELDGQIDAYESALVAGQAKLENIAQYLPALEDPSYQEILIELLRITLEHQFQKGDCGSLDQILERFGVIRANPALLAPLAYEEYRLRCNEGQTVDRQDYARRYGVDVSSWHEIAGEPAEGATASNGNAAASWTEFSQSVPVAAAKLAVARRRLPTVGERFGPFQLAALLGQGAFGKVFLARQSTLAHRYVALKVTAGPTIEADRLARMQHSNVVPIYSVHRRGRLSGVCMPFLGSVTLADLIARFKAEARLPHSAQSLADTVAARQAELSTVVAPEASGAEQSYESRRPPSSDQTLAKLAARPLEEAICWIIARVAAGLAHAHQRGIIHRDLKPANILIGDDGEPLVLDFNLSTDRTPAAGHLARLGGTLPYMAPEQFESFQGGSAEGSAASDVFSLGVVLYESLTCRHPFPIRHGTLDEVVVLMLHDRQELAPTPIRRLNAAVSPGLASIVEKCLEPNPARRYRDAAELHEDLQRHLNHQPLRFARERSVVEVARKWRQRHPRLTSATSVALMSILFAAVAGSIWLSRDHQQAARIAEDDFQAFHAAVPSARTLLLVSNPASAEERDGIAAAKDVLGRYHVIDDPQWSMRRHVRLLSAPSRNELAADISDLQTLLARRELPASAKAWCSDAPWAADAAQAIQHRCQATDLLITAHARQRQGQTDTAQPLNELTRSQPADVASWMVLGDCRRIAKDFAGAGEACTAAIALRRDLYLTWYWRGIVRLQSGRPADAEADFNEALARRKIFPGGWANRGIARYEQGNYAAAIDDLTTAIDHGLEDPLVYFRRARCYEALKEMDAAKRDRELGARFQLQNAQMLYERGLAHVRLEDYQAAEQDFGEAVRLAPQFIGALRNLAHVQSEKLSNLDDAIATLNRIMEFKPDDPSARISRGVLYARQGKRDEALLDADVVLQRNPRPFELCQAASLYALLAKDDAAMRQKALNYLEKSLAQQPELAALVEPDPDMANLRHDERFIQLIRAAGGKPKQVADVATNSGGK